MAAVSSWQPQPEALRELAKCLRDSLDGANRNVQREAELRLKNAKISPDINNYLLYLVIHPELPAGLNLSSSDYVSARMAAAAMVKNDISSSYKSISPSSKEYINAFVLHGLRDRVAQMRNLTGNIVTELISQAGIANSQNILQNLVVMIENADNTSSKECQEGAMSALLKVCTDHKKALEQSRGLLDQLVPKLLEFTASPITSVRSGALASLNVFITLKSEAFLSNLDSLMARLFDLANDPSADVRKQICRAIVQTAEIAPGKIIPHMEGLVEYMISQQKNQSDPELALDAAEFWLCIGEDQNLRGALGIYLPKIVPTLLESMKYDEEDVLRLEAEALEDADVEDRAEDIKPRFAASKAARFGTTNGNANGSGAATSADKELSDGELDEYDEDDDEDDDDEDPEENWNLRKCSAAALDVLASTFHDAVFTTTLPFLKNDLTNPDWPVREAAVLAIGAIAEGCLEVIQPHLPELIPFLVSLLNDENPVVRQITCWTLGRYSGWASHLDTAGKNQFFLPMMDGILKRMLDKNKRVQEAAASAFANLEDKAGQEINVFEYCIVIVTQFAECFQRYKDRNMFILYDCVQTLAENVGHTLQDQQLSDPLMQALMQRWEKVPDQSQEMFPLLECLSYVSTALAEKFAPYAAPLYSRCVNLISQNLIDSSAAAENPALDMPDKDYLVTSLDLVSAILQALRLEKHCIPLVRTSHNIFQLLCVCLEDSSPEVRQSAYALLGDCAIYVFSELRPYIDQIMPKIFHQLMLPSTPQEPQPEDDDGNIYAVSNNACWSCGEIALKHKEGMRPYAEQLLQCFGSLLANAQVPTTLHENAAIAIGRLGVGCSDTLAPHLKTFAQLFLMVISSVAWTDEKASALYGFSAVVVRNPQGSEDILMPFLSEIARLPDDRYWPIFESERPLNEVIQAYRKLLPDFDAAVLVHMQPQEAALIRERYMQ